MVGETFLDASRRGEGLISEIASRVFQILDAWVTMLCCIDLLKDSVDVQTQLTSEWVPTHLLKSLVVSSP